MSIHTRFFSAALALTALLGIAGCSQEQGGAAVVSEAHAAPLNPPDYGWRTSQSPTAEPNGTVYEYQ